jgi:hypothetical protein
MIPSPMTPAWEFLNVVESSSQPLEKPPYHYIADGQYTTGAMRQLTHVKH